MAVTSAVLLSICVVLTMFLKKLLNKNETKPEQKQVPPPGMQTMGASLQKRFAKGVQYNSKLKFCIKKMYLIRFLALH